MDITVDNAITTKQKLIKVNTASYWFTILNKVGETRVFLKHFRRGHHNCLTLWGFVTCLVLLGKGRVDVNYMGKCEGESRSFS